MEIDGGRRERVAGGGEGGEERQALWADLGEARGEREGVDRDGRGEGCRG